MMNYLVLILSLVVVFSFYIFYLRYVDDRYLITLFFAMVVISAFGLDEAYKFIKKYNKIFAIILVIGILLFGAYYQVTYADNLIKVKATSFLQVRQGFEWIRDNAPEGSVIIGRGIEPYAVYYAEKNYMDLPRNESEAYKIDKANYSVIHAFTNQDAYYQTYLQNNQDKWQPIQAYFFDTEKTQPALIIFQKF